MPKTYDQIIEIPATVLGSEDSFRLLVESVKDYAIVMLDPTGMSSAGTRAPNASRLQGRGDHRRAFLCFYPAQAIEARRARTGIEDRGQKRAVRGRRLACAEGWKTILGQRHHLGIARQGRHAAGVFEVTRD